MSAKQKATIAHYEKKGYKKAEWEPLGNTYMIIAVPRIGDCWVTIDIDGKARSGKQEED